MARQIATRAQIVDAYRALAPWAPLRLVAAKFGITPQRVGEVLKAENIGRPPRQRWTAERIQSLRDLAEAGMTRADAAATMGEDYDAVVHACKFYGIEMALAYRRWTGDVIDDIIRQLRAGFSVHEVAAKIGVKSRALQSILQYRASPQLAAIRSGREHATVADWMRYRSTPTRQRPAPRAQPPCDPKFRDGLYQRVHALVPRGLDSDIRDDIFQNVIIAVLEGALLDADLVNRTIKAHFRAWSWRQMLSLDLPAFAGTNRPLHEFLDTEGNLHRRGAG